MDKEICIGFIKFSIFLKISTCVYQEKTNLILIKKTSCVKENIIYFLTEMEFDGEKIPQTYENELWNPHNAKIITSSSF